jgi:iron complex outermembrane recepter protein
MRFNSALSTAASTIAIGVAAIATPAFAQSTGTQDFEKEIVVTGTRTGVQQVEGVSAPDTSKAKAVLTSEAIQRAAPGQTVLDTINRSRASASRTTMPTVRRAARSASAAFDSTASA